MRDERTGLRAAIALIVCVSLLGCPMERSSDIESREYLDHALRAERWLAQQAIETAQGRIWRSVDEKDDHPVTTGNLYYGSAGTVLFYLELYQQTGDPDFKTTAEAGARYLIAAIPDSIYMEKGLNALDLYPSLNQPADSEFPVYTASNGLGHPNQVGLYWGVSGIGFTLGEVYRVTGDDAYRRAALRIVDLMLRDHHRDAGGVTWGSSPELMTGDAGAGLFLLYAARELGHAGAMGVARSIGDSLLARAIESSGGLMWPTRDVYGVDYPNFAHGTSGIGYFLATLSEETGDPTYRQGAERAGIYLENVAEERGLVPHHQPDATGLVYYGWCHGPVGTNRLFEKLVAGEPADRWARFLERSGRAVEGANLRKREPRGFWENVGQCCGSAGLGDYFLTRYRRSGKDADLERAKQMTADILAHAIRDGDSLHWAHAEHRGSPDYRPVQTGYMQGAAGIGMHLLRMHAAVNGLPLSIRMLDDRSS